MYIPSYVLFNASPAQQLLCRAKTGDDGSGNLSKTRFQYYHVIPCNNQYIQDGDGDVPETSYSHAQTAEGIWIFAISIWILENY